MNFLKKAIEELQGGGIYYTPEKVVKYCTFDLILINPPFKKKKYKKQFKTQYP